MIRYLKNKDGGIHIFNIDKDGDLPEGFTELSETELEDYLNPTFPVPTTEQLAEQVRAKRDGFLYELDVIVSNPLRWGEFSEAEKQALAEYRQALLDVPQQGGFPENVVFPDKPDFIIHKGV